MHQQSVSARLLCNVSPQISVLQLLSALGSRWYSTHALTSNIATARCRCVRYMPCSPTDVLPERRRRCNPAPAASTLAQQRFLPETVHCICLCCGSACPASCLEQCAAHVAVPMMETAPGTRTWATGHLAALLARWETAQGGAHSHGQQSPAQQ